MLNLLQFDGLLLRMQGVTDDSNMCGPCEHDVMGAGGDRAWQWAGGADDHLDQRRNQRHRPASCSQTGMPALPSVMIPWRDKTCPTGG